MSQISSVRTKLFTVCQCEQWKFSVLTVWNHRCFTPSANAMLVT